MYVEVMATVDLWFQQHCRNLSAESYGLMYQWNASYCPEQTLKTFHLNKPPTDCVGVLFM